MAKDYFCESFTVVRELSMFSLCFRMFAAIILGGIIGIERGMKNRPAGLRTYMLVSLGACIVMMTNQYVYQVYHTGDLVRMGAQVVSGIGFLGAGTIIVTSRNQIKGLTTAAGLWAAACVGLSIGIGLYEVAVIGSAMIWVILMILHKLDFVMRHKTKVVDAYVELNKKTPLGDFLRYARENYIEPSNVQMEHDNVAANNSVAFIVTLKSQKRQGHDAIFSTIRKMEGVSYIEEL